MPSPGAWANDHHPSTHQHGSPVKSQKQETSKPGVSCRVSGVAKLSWFTNERGADARQGHLRALNIEAKHAEDTKSSSEIIA